MTDLTCSNARDAISAQVDGELDDAGEQRLDAHLGHCESCQGYQNDAFELRRALTMRIVQAESAPSDAAAAAATSAAVAGSLRTVSLLRYALFVIGATLVTLNVSPILSLGTSPAAHLDRHDGVFGAALGIGMLAVAAKPHRAIGLIPITSAVAVLMSIVAVADLAAGRANLLSEAIHVLQFGGLVCLWVISGGPSRAPHHLAALSRRIPGSLRISS